MKRNVRPFHLTTSYYRKVKRLINVERNNVKILSEKQCAQTYAISAENVNRNPKVASSPKVCIPSTSTQNDFNIIVQNTNHTEDNIELENNHENVSEMSEEEEEDIEKKLSIMEDLRNWALVHRITHRALSDLLGILKLRGNHFLPKDARTLLQTPQIIDTVSMDSGKFWYYGLRRCLIYKFSDIDYSMSISITFNIDGLPIFNSAKTEFWPILCISDHPKLLNPMPIALYCGQAKPNLQNYLDPFVNELQDILENGVQISHHKITVKIKGFVCDTPARCFIKGTVYFNHYHGCPKCTAIGENYEYKRGFHMSYPKINAPLRTDESFRNRLDIYHHREDSPLEKLPINIVDDFPVADSLHLFDLGIMRKCLMGWINGSFNFKTKWLFAQISQVSKCLENSNKYLPKEIHRAMRSLQNIKFWKGLEYRTFLLYVGPAILKEFLTIDVYQHFIMLFCAVTICSCKHYLKHLNVAEALFQDYIKIFIDIYGIDSVSSNVHSICHVTADVKKFGHLPSFSAYPFENTLYQIKNLVRQGNKPLEQVAKRLLELTKIEKYDKVGNSTAAKFPFVKCQTQESHNLPNCIGIYRQIYIMEGVMFSNDLKNKWFLTKENEIVEMINATFLNDKIVIYGTSIVNKQDYFDKPFKSSFLNIFKSDDSIRNSPKLYNLKDIKCKLISIEQRNEKTFLPLLHTLDLFLE